MTCVTLGGLLLLVSLGSCSYLNRGQTDESDILDEYRIELDYPSNWQSLNAEIESPLLLNSVEVIELSPQTNGTPEENVSIKVILETLPERMTLEQFYTKIVLPKLAAYGKDKLGKYGNEVLEKKPFTLIGDKPAYQVVYSRFDGEENIKGMIVFTLGNQEDDLAYIIHYVAPENKYEEFLNEAQAIAQSLQPSI